MIPLLTRAPRIPAYNPARGERIKDYVRYSELRQLVYKIVELQRRRDTFSSLAVLSLFPSEGRTLLCAALAVAYAETCRSRVLAVDTTTMRDPKSLSLKQCLDPSDQMIDFVSLTDHRGGASADSDVIHSPDGGVLEAEILGQGSTAMTPTLNDHYLVTKVTKNGGKQYGLVVLDTAPLTARNKNNFDPSLVARLSDASVLIVGARTLESPELSGRLQTLEDPGLHLIGAVANEAYFR